MPSRVIKLVCLNHPHVVEFIDTGKDKNGDPTSNRQALVRVLGKRVLLDSGARVPTFQLAEPPVTTFVGDEEFDDATLRDRGTGNWLLPTPEWRATQKSRCESRTARAEAHEDHAREAMAKNVTGAMIDLARSLGPTAAVKPPKPAPAKAGAA